MFSLQPQARPVDAYTAPEPVSNEVAGLARGLASFGNNLSDVATKYGGMTAQALEAEATEYAKIQAAKAENIAAFDAAVKRGEIKYQDVPWVNTMIRQQVAANVVTKNAIDATAKFQEQEDQFNTSDEVIAFFQQASLAGLDPNDPEIAAVALPAANKVALQVAEGFVERRSQKRDKDLQSAISDGVMLAMRTGDPVAMLGVSERTSVLVPREKVIRSAMAGFRAAMVGNPDLAGSQEFEDMVAAFKVKNDSGEMVSILDTAEGTAAFEEIKETAINMVAARDAREVQKENRAEQKTKDFFKNAALQSLEARRKDDGTVDVQAVIGDMQRFGDAPISVVSEIVAQLSSINRNFSDANDKEYTAAVTNLVVTTKKPLNEVMDLPYKDGMTVGDYARERGMFPQLLQGWGAGDAGNNFTDEEFTNLTAAGVTTQFMMSNSHRMSPEQQRVAVGLLEAQSKELKIPDRYLELVETSIKHMGQGDGSVSSAALGEDMAKIIGTRVDIALSEFKADYAMIVGNPKLTPEAREAAIKQRVWDISGRYGGYSSEEDYRAATDLRLKAALEAEQKAKEFREALAIKENETAGARITERQNEWLKNAGPESDSRQFFALEAIRKAVSGINPTAELKRIGLDQVRAVGSPESRFAFATIDQVANGEMVGIENIDEVAKGSILRASEGVMAGTSGRILFFPDVQTLKQNVGSFTKKYKMSDEEARKFYNSQWLSLFALEAQTAYANNRTKQQPARSSVARAAAGQP